MLGINREVNASFNPGASRKGSGEGWHSQDSRERRRIQSASVPVELDPNKAEYFDPYDDYGFPAVAERSYSMGQAVLDTRTTSKALEEVRAELQTNVNEGTIQATHKVPWVLSGRYVTNSGEVIFPRLSEQLSSGSKE